MTVHNLKNILGAVAPFGLFYLRRIRMLMQQIYDQVATHLLKQKATSMRTDPEYPVREICAYRGDGGKMCAVGCLIKDEFYDASLENSSIANKDVLNAVKLSLDSNLSVVSLHLLGRLQRLHDGVNPMRWESALKKVAEEFELKPICE